MRAAVPAYVGEGFEDCPPGHCFGLYFPVWKDDWTLEKERKGDALKQVLSLPRHAQETVTALRSRQETLLEAHPKEARLSIEARSTAPFATGLGLEHPLENGFAFLNPYGLAYLPGTSIKGVLRRAAEELASELDEADRQGWNQDAITALFGLEGEDRQNEHLRGTLSFWDAIPSPANNSMGMDVMTPHYGEYYQGRSTPHDSGQPNPIVFLVVPEGSEFSFNLTCDTARLPQPLRATWRDLLRAAFAHAFEWLGFGAKTAVGYGALKRDVEREAVREEEVRKEAEQRRQAAEEHALAEAQRQRLAAMDPLDREMEEAIAAERDKARKPFLILLQALREGRWKEDAARRVAERVRAEMQEHKVWRETSTKKNPEKDHDFQRTQEVMRYLAT